ncbi:MULTISPECIES: FAD binding domain-containing protein [Prauserella salsuginis group]|uniref:Carbon-monoxide dehydrogenase medium subunit n=2 Tax=Prauserella salsuginis group TaxID=2893672 RepID=A0A839XR90_9PSEU|nr:MULTISPECIES: FAD binding domain-containing protein [Prauserella salsuginis group]MBB3663964.1 carbon-monoxide dehydrogenase medium subunit [Prauserella sediminis]MCR3721420.1 carbon-monoxide dehydrogenase medium subunit [Prauserella flava]MCR3732410.1 carbon-monoxide dehydrogenase medium subunit [Prauserella salsuginis]
MKPPPFTYHRARDVAGATDLVAELGEDAKFLAGGQSLIPMMNFRLARPEHLIDIGRLGELSFVDVGPESLRVGSLSTHRAVETADLGAGFEVVRDTMRWIGHLPIRTKGTVGGSLAHADATAEWCLLAVLLDADIVVAGAGGRRRTIAASEAFLGFYTTVLEEDELIVEVAFGRPAPHAAVTEFAERKGDFALVSAAVDLDVSSGTVSGGRVALGGVGPAVVRVPEAERVLHAGGRAGTDLFETCAQAAAQAVEPPGDDDAGTGYRKALVRNLVVRACEEAVAR